METEIDEEKSFIIVYDGKVWRRSKDFGTDYLGLRCAKQPKPREKETKELITKNYLVALPILILG